MPCTSQLDKGIPSGLWHSPRQVSVGELIVKVGVQLDAGSMGTQRSYRPNLGKGWLFFDYVDP